MKPHLENGCSIHKACVEAPGTKVLSGDCIFALLLGGKSIPLARFVPIPSNEIIPRSDTLENGKARKHCHGCISSLVEGLVTVCVHKRRRDRANLHAHVHKAECHSACLYRVGILRDPAHQEGKGPRHSRHQTKESKAYPIPIMVSKNTRNCNQCNEAGKYPNVSNGRR